MEEVLAAAARIVARIADAIAILVIAIGVLEALIAAIRTFLTYFLDRDMDVMRDLQHTGTRSVGDA